MKDTNTGGPAFAQQLESNRDGYAVTGGMTLRDYFAAQAMSGLVVNGDNFDLPRLAAYSYEMADAMLKARES